MPIFSIANSIGISENYFKILQSFQRDKIINSPPSSSSSSSSFNYSSSSTSMDSTNTYNSKNVTKILKSKKKVKNEIKFNDLVITEKMIPCEDSNQNVPIRDLIGRFNQKSISETNNTPKSKSNSKNRSKKGLETT